MGGLWRKLWWRTLCAWGLAIFVGIAVPLLAIAIFVMKQATGPLDFAGGAVVHVSPLALLIVPWLGVEGYNLRRKVPVPFGSYAAFTIAFAVSLRLTAYAPERVRPAWGSGGILFTLIGFAMAGSAGLAAGWAYAWVTRKNPGQEGHF